VTVRVTQSFTFAMPFVYPGGVTLAEETRAYFN
jgi:hypothetical protein